MLINEIIPSIRVLADYARSIGYPFESYEDILKTIAHYKNFGALLN